MQANSISDIRKSWGGEWAQASDEQVLCAFAKAANMDPTYVAYRLGYAPASGALTCQNSILTDSAYQVDTGKLTDLPVALFESLGVTVLIAVIYWVVYKKYLEKSLFAKTQANTGLVGAVLGAALTLSAIPHQFKIKSFTDAAVGSLALLLMYSAIGFCLGWAYRTLRPAVQRKTVGQRPVSAPVMGDSIRRNPQALAPLTQPLVMTREEIKPPTEEEHWATALAELDEGQRRQGVWAKAFADADGDDVKARVAYLKARVQQLTSSAVDR